MKPNLPTIHLSIFLSAVMVLMFNVANAVTYYSFGNNAPNLTAQWWTGTNGTGTHPANFTSTTNIFIVQNGHTYNSTAAWANSGIVQVQAGGTLSTGAGAGLSITIGGTTTVAGTLLVRNTSVKTFTGNVTVNSGGVFTISGNQTVNLTGNLSVLAGGIINHNNSYDNATIYLQVNGHFSIDGTYNYAGFTPAVWLNGSGSRNISTGTSSLCKLLLRQADYYASGTVTVDQDFYAMWNQVGGSFHTNNQTVNANWGLVNNGGTLYIDGGTLNVGSTVGGMLIGRTLTQDGAVIFSAGTLNTAGIYLGTTTISPKGSFTQSGGIINSSILDIGNTCSFVQSGGTNNINGSVNLNYSTSTYSHTTGTTTLNIAGSLLNNGVYSTAAGTANINIAGSWINNLTVTSSSTSTVTFNGTSNQTIGGTAATTFNNLIINPLAGVSVTSSVNSSVVGNLDVLTGTLDLATFACNRTLPGGTLSLASGTALKVSGGSGGAGSSNFPNNFSTYTLHSNSLVEYYGTVAQTIYATPSYGYLTLSGNSTKTAGGGITIAKDLNINSSSVFAGSTFAHSIAGDWKNNVSVTAYTPGTSTVTFNGSALQTIGGTFGTTFNNLTANNAAGIVISQDQGVNATLTLTSGLFNISTQNLTFGSAAAAAAGSPFSATKMIIADGGGEVRKVFSATGSYLFPIGDNTGTAEYSPISLNITSGTFAVGAYQGVKVTNAKHPNNASTTHYLNRYWTVSNSGITSTAYTATSTYVAADIAGTESTIAAAKFTTAIPWIKYGVISSNTLTATAVNNTGAGIIFSGITNMVPVATITGGGVTICPSASVALGSTVTNNGTSSIAYAWSPSTGLSSAVVSNPTATPSGTATYTLTLTDGNGITSTPVNTTITISTPAAPTATVTVQPTCSLATGTITITAPMAAGMTYSTNGITYTNTTGIFTGMSAATYSLTAKNSTGCISSITSVTVNAQPATPAAPTASVTVQPTCSVATGTITITAPTAVGMTYSTDGATYTNTTGIFTGMATATYTLTAKNSSGCISTGTTVTVNAQPVRPTGTISGTTSICSGGTANLTLAVTGTGTISGTLSNGTVFSGTAPSIGIVVSPLSGITYTISTLTNGTCAALPAGMTGSAVITVNPIPTATISYPGSPYCWNSGTAPITFAGTSGGVFSASSAGAWLNSTNGTIDLASSVPGIYTITYTVAAAGGCAAVTANTVVVINPNTWTGGINSHWDEPGNWAANAVPTIACPDVTILAGVPYQPRISSGSFAVQNLFIMPGAHLVVENAVLEISGTISNSGTLTAVDGTIRMNGSSAQTIPANTFFNNALKNLVISNTSVAGVTLGGSLDIYGSLTYTGSGKKFTTNDLLTLKSTATNTASVGVMTGHTIVGKVTVERYISAKRAWHILSVPTNTSQTIKQAWQEGASNSSDIPSGFYGIQITTNKANWASNGFDFYSPAGPSMKTYNSSAGGWIDIGSTNIPFSWPTNAYMTFVRGDRTANSLYATPTVSVLRTKGNLFTGDQAPITVGASKFELIGNPFASALDMRLIARTGIKDFYYIWDPKLSGTNGLGAYQTFSLTGTDYEVTPGMGSYGAAGSIYNFIQSGQGFMIQATAAGGNITFKENAKASGSILAARPANPSAPKFRANLYGLTENGSSYMTDGILINYDDNFSNAVDEMDALKAGNSNENFGIKTGASLLAIERRHSISQKDTIFLSMKKMNVQSYRFDFIAQQFNEPGLFAFLEDSYLKTKTPLTLDGRTTVKFSVLNAPESANPDRFRIIFETATVLPVQFASVKAWRRDNANEIEWKVENELNVKEYELERSTDQDNFRLIHTTQAKNNGAYKYNYLDLTSKEGYTYYRVKSVDESGRFAYSQVVKIKVQPQAEEISVYPNPVSDGMINLQMKQSAAGIYAIRLLNSNGQVMMAKKIKHLTANGTESMNAGKNIPAGVYELEVTNPGGSKYFTKIIF